MSNIYFFLLLALVAGAMMPTQAAINNKMAVTVGSPILAAFISFLVGTIALLVYAVATGVPLGDMASAKNAPPIAWAGGILGAFFVASAVILVPRIGVAMTFSFARMRERYRAGVNDVFESLGLQQAAALDRRVIESLWDFAPPGVD
jgi:transporter family-2 protein